MTYLVTAFNIDFTGLQTADANDNLVSAAIRIGLPLTNGAAAFGFFGDPFDDTGPSDMVFTPFTNAVGGVISGKWDASEGNNTTLTEQLAGDNLEHHRLYLDLRTTQFPRGEIRGVLEEVVQTPEPASFTLWGLGVGTLALLAKRGHRPKP